MATRMQQRRGTAAEWSAANPVLGAGEIGYTTDTKLLKVGDGVTAWNTLVGISVDKLDGLDSTDFLLTTGKAADSNLLDGLDSTAFMLATATKTVRIPHTFTITGEVKVASGDTNYIPPFYIPVISGQTVKASSVVWKLNSGTSCTAVIQRQSSAGVFISPNLADATITTTTQTVSMGNTVLASNDRIALIVTTVSGTPKNLSATVYLDYTF